jgi:tRNA(Ile)-lysidine synthase
MSELKKNNPEVKIQAVHVNHQINTESNNWALHCKKICNELNIPIFIEAVDINLKPGDSLEENARDARYAALRKYIDKNSVLLTAHNTNDQAETFLLQALRGAGSKGLSAMPVKKKLGEGFLIRPLLHFSRNELEKYARDNHLQWIEDDSNVDPRFRRNFLRHEIFPLLKKNWPTVMENFSRSARLIASQEKITADYIQNDFEKIKVPTSSEVRASLSAQADSVFPINKINLKILREFSSEKQKLLLREWFSQNNLRMPNEKHLKQIQKDVINAASDAHPVFQMGDVIIKRDHAFLFLVRKNY